MRPHSSRAQRGSTIIEVMVAAFVMLVGMLGFVFALQYAATATAAGHRRTSATLIRAGLIDRLVVTPRSALDSIPSSWVVDQCFDQNAQVLASNAAHVTGYACPAATTSYQSWINVARCPGAVGCPAGVTNYQVAIYVERTGSGGCTSAQRYSSFNCSAADLLLTD